MSSFAKDDAVEHQQQEMGGDDDHDQDDQEDKSDQKNFVVYDEVQSNTLQEEGAILAGEKEPFFFDPDLSINTYCMVESKTSLTNEDSIIMHCSAIIEESDLYNRNAMTTGGREAIWNQIVDDFNSSSSAKKQKKISLGSSTAAASDVELEIHQSNQSHDDARLSSHIFSVLDKVMTPPLMRSLNLRYAQLVVLGMESHGKSSLLERLLKLDTLFPKGKGRCTTAILRAELRRGPTTLATVSIRNRLTLEESYEKTDVSFLDLETVVRRLMDTITKQIEHPRLIGIEHEVLIRITREDLPNLNLVDLPGIVSMNDGGNPSQDLAKATYELAESVVQQEKDHSIFLLVVDVRTQVNHSKAAELVRLQEVEQQTIGVFTKLDVFQPESEDENLSEALVAKLQDRSCLKTHGWLACANREPPSAYLKTAAAAIVGLSREDYRFALMAGYESRLLRYHGDLCHGLPEHVKEESQSSLLGIAAIRSRVQVLFEDFLLADWVPHCLSSLKTELKSLYAHHAALGLPIVLSAAEDESIEELRRFHDLLAVAADKAKTLIHPDYNTVIFEPWSADRIQELVMAKVSFALDEYVSCFDLCNGRAHDDLRVAAVWTCISDYNKLIQEKEQRWEERYCFKQFIALERNGESATTEEDKQALANYATDFKSSSMMKQNLYLPALQAARTHLTSLVDQLLSFWDHEQSVDAVYSGVDNKTNAEDIIDNQHAFEGFEDGLFFNLLQRFPLAKKTLLQQVSSIWKEEKDRIKSFLFTMITDDSEATPSTTSSSSLASSLLNQTHFYCSSSSLSSSTAESGSCKEHHRHLVLLQWSEQGKSMAHRIVTGYLDLMRDMFAKVAESIDIPIHCFAREMPTIETGEMKEEGRGGGGGGGAARVSILQQIKDCIGVCEVLSELPDKCPQLFFRRQKKIPSRPVVPAVPLRSFANDHCIELQGHDDTVHCVIVMPDGITIASGSEDKTVKIWNSNDGRCILTVPCPSIVSSLLTMDDQTILAGLNGEDGKIVKIRVDSTSGRGSIVDTWTGHSENVVALALLDDGRSVLSCSFDRALKLWDSRDGSCLATLTGHSRGVFCLAILPPPLSSSLPSDYHQLAVSGSEDRTLIIWDLVERKAFKTLSCLTGSVSSVACLSHDRIVSGSRDFSVRLWDVISGDCLGFMKAHSWIFSLAALSSDVIASGSRGKTIIWQVSTGQGQTLLGHSESGVCLFVLSDGRLVSGSDWCRDKMTRLFASGASVEQQQHVSYYGKDDEK